MKISTIKRCLVCAASLDHAQNNKSSNLCSKCLQHDLKPKRLPLNTTIDFTKLRSTLKTRGRGSYDILLMCSGGKDSCYLAVELAKLGVYRILLFSCNTGYISSEARENLDFISKRTSLDHYVFRPSSNLMATVYKAVLRKRRKEWYAEEMCQYCYEIIQKAALLLACRFRIPYIVTGHDPTQYYGQKVVVSRKNLTGFVGLREDMSKALDDRTQLFLDSLHREVRRSKLLSYLLPCYHFPSQVAIYGIVGYNQDIINNEMKKYGLPYIEPKYTNCLVDALMMELQFRENGCMFYEDGICEKVRHNMLSRENAMKMLLDWENEARDIQFTHAQECATVREDLGVKER